MTEVFPSFSQQLLLQFYINNFGWIVFGIHGYEKVGLLVLRWKYETK